MKQSFFRCAQVGLIGFLLCSCNQVGPGEGIGTMGGAVVGALLGSQVGQGNGRIVATALGTLLGGLAGSAVGRHLDAADRAKANAATVQALESSPDGQACAWSNPNTRHSGNIVPVRTFYDHSRPCREFHHTVMMTDAQGKVTQEVVKGCACRDSNGEWKIVPQ